MNLKIQHKNKRRQTIGRFSAFYNLLVVNSYHCRFSDFNEKQPLEVRKLDKNKLISFVFFKLESQYCRKKRGYKGSFLAICNFVFSFSISNLVLEFFPSTGTKKRGTDMFNDPANLREIPLRRKLDKCYSKDPYSIFRKAFRNRIELHRDRYLSMRRLSNQSPFDNLSHGVFFSVDLFLRRRRPMNITSVVAGNPRFHHIKTVF